MKLPTKPLLLQVLIPSFAVVVSAECTRGFLTGATERYILAQSAGNIAALTAIASPSLNYTESDVVTDIHKSVLTQPMKIDHGTSIHDPVNCATFTELIVTGGGNSTANKPYVIGTRMAFSADASNTYKATLIETIATKPGDWAFNATGYLHWTSRENWAPIPASKRDSRAVIKAAGDAYFDRFANVNASVPWGDSCQRLEGGAYTDTRGQGGNTCNLGLPSTLVVTNRRYVVDEEMGAVAIFVGFPGLDRSVGEQPMPDSHLFRVEGGRIRYIHTVSTCVHAGCGMNGSGIPGQKRFMSDSGANMKARVGRRSVRLRY
ncbi:hypothetical protein B0H66DRAFT_546053 [Apodospora peruviana]|uniref:DUF8021 domain-containing protein n=1 Tax=Apodospora peruviana TaxID=516989 RepID=A0AAE0IU34_9PEZI|nr:hypothetical protein B0H66DRAFT_546053 [Apodospora peruviana]